MRKAALCFSLVLSSMVANAADIISSFRPATLRSDYGITSEVEFSTPFVELESRALAHHVPAAMKSFTMSEPVWVIAYKSWIVDARGNEPRENYLCHTFLADQHVDQHPENELKGIYSDAFTPEVILPHGFGVPLKPDDPMHWMPMFNNRGDDPVRIAMKVVMTVIRAKDLRKPLTPLYASLRSVQVPHLFFVPPGKEERQIVFQLPFNGRIHFLGTHLHPYGESVELYNLTRHERVWKGSRTAGPESLMEVYSSTEGYAIHAGDSYRITTQYDNTTKEKIDAMAGLFMLYSRN